MNSNRLESIDVARGLAALSVAVFHHGFGHVLTAATGWRIFELLAWPGARIAVPVFFVISGFCIHLGWLSRKPATHFTRGFLIQRFFRIYPPWVVAILVSALVLWLDGRPPDGRQMLSYFTLTNGFFADYRLNAALWSVSVESLLYLIYPFWLTVRLRHGLVAAAWLAFGVSATSGAVTAHFFKVPTGPSMWFFLNVWCGWVIGAIFAEQLQEQTGRILHRRTWWLAGSLVWGLHVLLKFLGAYQGPWAFAYLPITISLCVWPLALLILAGETIARRRPPWLIGGVWSLMARIGVFSYSLYLLHIPLQSLRLYFNAQLTGSLAKGALFTGWFGLVLGAAWLCHRWVEEPSAQWGRRIIARIRSVPHALPAPQAV
jgi:peptidoglycan/LPS O-acetylase OafA/YrhL